VSHPPSRPPLASGQSWELASTSSLPSHCLTSWGDPPLAGRASTVKGLCGLSHGVPHLLPLGAVALCANHRLVTVRRLRPGQGSLPTLSRGRARSGGQGRQGRQGSERQGFPRAIRSPPSQSSKQRQLRRPGCALPAKPLPTDLESSEGWEGWQGEETCSSKLRSRHLSAPGTR
jgi:hypothetical protein